jgi:serine/threonine protein kinase
VSRPLWTRVRPILEEVLELSPEQREDSVNELSGGDTELAEEVMRLLELEDGVAPSRRIELLEDTAFRKLFASDGRPGPGAEQGGFRIRREIGAGGMGRVFEAVQENPERVVALKVLAPGMAWGRHAARFREETQFLARLQHPGIAQIYDAGLWVDSSEDPLPYFAMEYVEGAKDLVQYSREAHLSMRQRVALFGQVCEAVQHGHEKGVLHRDLKPSNILVGLEGRPKVIDYGVARTIELEESISSSLTLTGELVGTIRYMSPEQVRGEKLDVRSDVYSLGVVLYECLCDRAPYGMTSTDLASIAMAILETAPIRPGLLEPGLRGDLEWVLLRALEKDPERRYGSVAELAADLDRYLADEPLVAGPPGSAYKLKKFVQRNRVSVGASVLLLLGLSVGLGVSVKMYLSYIDEQHLREREEILREATQSSLLSQIRSLTPNNKVAVRVDKLLDSASADASKIFADDLIGEIECRLAITKSYSSLGLFERAEREGRHALRLMTGVLDPGALEFVLLQTSIARAMKDQGRHQEAMEMIRGVAESTSASLGEDHIAAALARGVQGHLVAAIEGDLVGGERLMREALEVLVRELGDLDVSVLQLETNLAGCLNLLGRREESLAMYASVRERSDQIRGEGETDAIFVGLGEAGVFRELGRVEEALALVESRYERVARTLADSHPMRLYLTSALASYSLDAGRPEYARQLLESSQDWMIKVWGDEHHETLKAEDLLADALMLCGELEASLDLRRRTFEKARRAIDPKSPMLMPFLYSMGQGLVNAAELDEGFEFLEEALALGVELYGPNNPNVLFSTLEVCNLYGKARRPREALEKARWVVGRLEQIDDPDRYLLARAHLLEGKILAITDRGTEAIGPLRKAYDFYRAELGPESAKTLEAKNLLRNAER